ncbi:MAG: transcriptional regulator [Phenylobacterium sp.]|nr:transcriptional regulator [Phenylobacterium sp.]MDB5493130.1 transcriptional regulator [Phenylobacterium sp.]
MRRRGRHPSPQARTDYLTGNMAPGAALAMTVHFETCALCNVPVEPRGGRTLGEWFVRGEAADDGSPIGPNAGAVGAWRRTRPGLRVADVRGVSGLGEATFLLRLAPRAYLPEQRRARFGQLVILHGGLVAGGERLAPGDLIDFEEQAPPRLQADGRDGCLCLVTTDGTWPTSGLDRLRGLFRNGQR